MSLKKLAAWFLEDLGILCIFTRAGGSGPRHETGRKNTQSQQQMRWGVEAIVKPTKGVIQSKDDMAQTSLFQAGLRDGAYWYMKKGLEFMWKGK